MGQKKEKDVKKNHLSFGRKLPEIEAARDGEIKKMKEKIRKYFESTREEEL